MGKRQFTRKIKRLTITFTDGVKEHSGVSSDFSSNGIFIRTRKPFKPGTSLKMVLEINENKKIELTGIVARAIKFGTMVIKDGMGVRLDSIPDAYEDFLMDLLDPDA